MRLGVLLVKDVSIQGNEVVCCRQGRLSSSVSEVQTFVANYLILLQIKSKLNLRYFVNYVRRMDILDKGGEGGLRQYRHFAGKSVGVHFFRFCTIVYNGRPLSIILFIFKSAW